MIPTHDADGNLPPGVHIATWPELVSRYSSNAVRANLVNGLYRAALALKAAGISTLYIDGSFVTTKDLPGDFDACWDTAGANSSKLDPVLLDFSNGRIAQKIKYGGELFPSSGPAAPGQLFLDFFQRDRITGRPKGILAVDLRSFP